MEEGTTLVDNTELVEDTIPVENMDVTQLYSPDFEATIPNPLTHVADDAN